MSKISPIQDLKKKYPHAFNYITDKGMLESDEATRKTYEFEAALCDKVLQVFSDPDVEGIAVCPTCNSRTFKIGDTIIDFQFPFISDYRIKVMKLTEKETGWIKCAMCGMTRKMDPKEGVISLIPIRKTCQHCGGIYEVGLVKASSWPLEEGALCPACQKELGISEVWKNEHTTLIRTKYPPTKWVMWTGECSICNSFPCEHVFQDKSGDWKLKEDT